MTDAPEDRFARARKRPERDGGGSGPARPVSNFDELGKSGRIRAWARNAQATLEQHRGIWLFAGAGALLAFGALLYVGRARRRRERQRDALIGLGVRLLGGGTVAEPLEPRRSVLKDSLKQASLALATTAGRELGRRALSAVNTKLSDPEWRE